MGDLSQEYIKEIILDWEQRFPVNEWQIQGIHIWPYIRIKLYFFLLNINNEKYSSPQQNDAVEKSGLSRLKRNFKRIVESKILLHNFYSGLKPKKIIFFGSHFHRTKQDGLYFNRFFDPIVHKYNLHDEIYSVEFEKVYERNYNQNAILPLHKYLDCYKLLEKVEGLYKPKKKVYSELSYFNNFYNDLTNQFHSVKGLHLSSESLEKWAEKVKRNKDFFTKVFEKTKPEKIIFLSYYGYDDLAAAILAANDLGIKTIDFQHGPQTNVHMAYSSWTKLPDTFYNTMPLEYWTWDKESKKNIEEWTQKSEYLNVKIFGHPYLSYFRNEILKSDSVKEIMFSLQTLPLREMLPGVILNLIRGSNLKWIFRMHPRSNFSIQELDSFLSNHDIPKKLYKIEDSTNSPLPKSLAGARLHVTNFSGCVIEAGLLGIPSVIIHESGREMFKNYIDNKNVFYLNRQDPGFKENFIKIWEELPEVSEKRKFIPIGNPLD